MRLASLSLACLLLAGCVLVPAPDEPVPAPPPDAAAVTPSTIDAAVPTTNVFASSFDQYCTRDDDCVAVFEGNACDPSRCANAAIRRDALPEYRAELGAFWSCYEPAPVAACGAVIGDPAICVAGRCAPAGP